MIRVAVFAEHSALAKWAAGMLEGAGEIEVTAVVSGRMGGEAGESPEGVTCADVLVYVAERPEVALPWPEARSGRWPGIVVVDPTGQLGAERALALGAQGYVGADEPEGVWAQRIREASMGRLAFPMGRVETTDTPGQQAASLQRITERLTPPQLQLMRWNACGLAVKQIGRLMGISESAVRRRLARVRDKLGVETLEELAALAGRVGLDRSEDEDSAP